MRADPKVGNSPAEMLACQASPQARTALSSHEPARRSLPRHSGPLRSARPSRD